MLAQVTAINIYPVKSCKGIAVTTAMLTKTGLAFDRHWMIVGESGRFVTQREQPRLALIETQLLGTTLRLRAPTMPPIDIVQREDNAVRQVTVWRDTLQALDEGEEVATWLSDFLQLSVRLVRFDPNSRRLSNAEWVGDVEAHNEFADGYAMLVISEASLADLNNRLTTALPMNRFRPNLVLKDINAYDEDRIHELQKGAIQLRIVKPCTRCAITTTDQATGERDGTEPLATLKSYRWDALLRGVTFGQNMIVVAGVGESITVHDTLTPTWK